MLGRLTGGLPLECKRRVVVVKDLRNILGAEAVHSRSGVVVWESWSAILLDAMMRNDRANRI